MKKILLSSLVVFTLSPAQTVQEFISSIPTLSGSTKLACEAILCLSSGSRPSECNPSINHYFSIHKRKWKDTLNARRAFLGLCPVGSVGESDKVFTNLRDNIIVNLRGDCSLETLNELISNRNDWDDSDVTPLYKVNDKLLDSCKALMSSPYTYIKPVYECTPQNNLWLQRGYWARGYYYQRITYQEYQKLPADERYYNNDDEGGYWNRYFKKVPLKRDCWRFEE